MTRDLYLSIFVVILGATGTYLLLPHSHGARKPRNVHAVGAALGVLGLFLFSLLWTPPGPWISSLFFYVFGFGSIAGFPGSDPGAPA